MRQLALAFGLFIATVTRTFAADAPPTTQYYTEPPLYTSTPDPKSERHFGDVGVTGLQLRVYPGVVLQVEQTRPNTPAAGKFDKGDVIVGINGVALQGRNPYVVIGQALTDAEAKEGKLVFDVRPAGGTETKEVTVQIPVLGAYSPTWPVNCPKSKAIIQRAADYYARALQGAPDPMTLDGEAREQVGIPGALACLFLLSTGDDQYLPVVKAYFDRMGKNVKGIGDHTWNNGYNGIACAEYYLRTGDKSVLPILQYFCDNARERQFYEIGWGHWGRDLNPGYTSGGLMNAAGAQVATTLILAKQCGVQVDDATLVGALRLFYRFAGHGSVAYGDHRGEGGLGSNGKDGMAAALMHAACAAQGNVEIYRQARELFSVSMLDSYPALVAGHGDQGRGDAIWRSITSAYLADSRPQAYRDSMDRLKWWYDLSRRPSGALGVATCQTFNDEGSGAAMAIAYTAPLKTLQITGAPRSKFAKDFTLPEHLWGRPADRQFLSLEHAPAYRKSPTDEPVHRLLSLLGTAYSTPASLDTVPREELVRLASHYDYKVRTQAGKALMRTGAFADLEKLMEDPDPRVRRAAVDGLTDYRYWFAIGKNPIKPEQISPAMIASMRKMLTNPDEAIYVVDGALMALSCATPAAVAECLPDILPWTASDEWWVRQSAALALATAARAEGAASEALPALSDLLVRERRATARESMNGTISRLKASLKSDKDATKLIESGLRRAAAETEIQPGRRASEGGHYVAEAVSVALKNDPTAAPEFAKTLVPRLSVFQSRQFGTIVNALLAAREKLPEPARQELTDLLYDPFRQELIKRMDEGDAQLETLLSLTQLKQPDLGWHELGKPASAERVWRFRSFQPEAKDQLHPREGKRFRAVALPAGLENWHQPDFDASQWSSGLAPVGVGDFKPKRGKAPVIANRSNWGEGEFILLRTTFEIESLDYDFYRLAVLAKQGFDIYLNGKKIHTYIWWHDTPEYRKIWLNADATRHLKKGTNFLAVYANGAYVDNALVAQFDMRLEGLRKAELVGKPSP